jgi:hypothetical protein
METLTEMAAEIVISLLVHFSLLMAAEPVSKVPMQLTQVQLAEPREGRIVAVALVVAVALLRLNMEQVEAVVLVVIAALVVMAVGDNLAVLVLQVRVAEAEAVQIPAVLIIPVLPAAAALDYMVKAVTVLLASLMIPLVMEQVEAVDLEALQVSATACWDVDMLVMAAHMVAVAVVIKIIPHPAVAAVVEAVVAWSTSITIL